MKPSASDPTSQQGDQNRPNRPSHLRGHSGRPSSPRMPFPSPRFASGGSWASMTLFPQSSWRKGRFWGILVWWLSERTPVPKFNFVVNTGSVVHRGPCRAFFGLLGPTLVQSIALVPDLAEGLGCQMCLDGRNLQLVLLFSTYTDWMKKCKPNQPSGGTASSGGHRLPATRPMSYRQTVTHCSGSEDKASPSLAYPLLW